MKIKLVHEKAKVPVRKNPTDAGVDLFATECVVVNGYSFGFVDFGIQLEIPKGYVGMLFARSGLASKEGIKPRNCVGIIDSDYRGNVGVMLENDTSKQYIVQVGDRVAQLVVVPIELYEFEVVDELSTTERADGGFGSTGK